MLGRSKSSVREIKDSSFGGAAFGDGAPSCEKTDSVVARPAAARLLRSAAVGLACAIAYFIVLEAFLHVPMFNGSTQVRPASGLGPVLGLVFGFPAILGCAIANTISDSLRETNTMLLVPYFFVQIVYDAVLRVLWRLKTRNESSCPEFRLDSSRRIAGFLGMVLLDSVLVAVLLIPFEQGSMDVLNIHVVHALNNFLSLVYVGVPLLLVLGWARGRKSRKPGGLAERATLTALFGAGISNMICFLVVFLPRAFEATDSTSFAHFVAGVYIALSAMTVAMFVLACILLRTVETRLAHPIDRLSESSRKFAVRFEALGPEAVAAGALDEEFGDKKPLEEIAGLIDASNAMRRSLAENVIASRLAEREKERVTAEISIAAKIQEEMLPKEFSELRGRYGLEIDACMLPARQVGGDFYDVFSVDDSRICLLIADVSDKGVPASLFMMRAMTVLRDCVRSEADVADALMLANARLCKANDSSMFVTAFVIVLDVRTGRFRCSNAGHNPPWLFRSNGVQKLSLKPGLPLGMMDIARYSSDGIPLLPGEGVLLYTDGVTDSMNPDGALYGEERLRGVLESVLNDGPGRADHAVRGLVMDAMMFSSGVEQADDLTLLSFSWLVGASSLEVWPECEECDRATDFFREAFSAREVSRRTMFDIMLIVEETFVNIATHAFEDGREKRPVTLMAGTDPACGVLHMVFCDEGIAYDPTVQEAKPVSTDDQELVPGGLGVFLAREKSDGIYYDRLDGRNVLHIVKKLA